MNGRVLLLGLLLMCVFADTQASPTKPKCRNTSDPIVCPAIYSPLCGTDERTHSSECFLCAHIQSTGQDIWIARYGEC
ncbi:chymotrypsin inhibitor-like [Festucalex cinctus]